MYKVSFNQLRTFAEVVFIGILFRHDSYHLFLAIGSCMLAYFFAMSWFHSKLGRWLFFGFSAITLTQLSVTVKKAVMDMGFRQVAMEKPTGVLVGDVIYGFKAVYLTVLRAPAALYEAWGLDQYSTVESLNYRFMAIIVMVVILTVFVLKHPSIRPVAQPARR